MDFEHFSISCYLFCPVVMPVMAGRDDAANR
jgi:hypothetical protein